jgi:hypothetical protein
MSSTVQPAPGGFLAPGPAEATVTARPEAAVPAVFREPDWPDDEDEEADR